MADRPRRLATPTRIAAAGGPVPTRQAITKCRRMFVLSSIEITTMPPTSTDSVGRSGRADAPIPVLPLLAGVVAFFAFGELSRRRPRPRRVRTVGKSV